MTTEAHETFFSLWTEIPNTLNVIVIEFTIFACKAKILFGLINWIKLYDETNNKQYLLMLFLQFPWELHYVTVFCLYFCVFSFIDKVISKYFMHQQLLFFIWICLFRSTINYINFTHIFFFFAFASYWKLQTNMPTVVYNTICNTTVTVSMKIRLNSDIAIIKRWR